MYRCTISAVESLEPSSTTRISVARLRSPTKASTRSRASSIREASLKAGITMERIGTAASTEAARTADSFTDLLPFPSVPLFVGVNLPVGPLHDKDVDP